MQCSVAAGQQKAAEQALSISERELQRIKQQGCGTTRQDRSIMRLPDLRALPYPALADPILALEYDPNNKFTAVNQSQGFTQPFVDAVTAQDVVVRPTVPGSSMAGVGDLAAISGALLDQEDTVKENVYNRIATSIRGAPLKVSESSQTRQGQDEAAARELATALSAAELLVPIANESQVTAELLYGAGKQQEQQPFLQACRDHCRGALYDAMHFDSLAGETTCLKLRHIACRDGRLPHLLFVITLLCALAYFLAVLLRRR